MSLHSYRDAKSGAHEAPWRYDPSKKTATFDFTMFDQNLGIILDQMNVNCVSLAALYRIGAGDHGWIGDGGPWIETRTSTHREQNFGLADDLARAWARGLADHLDEKGWLDRVYVYVTDEPKPSTLETTARYCRVLKEAAPQLKTFGAGYNHHGWAKYFEYLDAFAAASTIPESVRKRLTERGCEDWSVYNRVGPTAFPLAKARIIGFDLWNSGNPGFFEHNCTGGLNHDKTINPKDFIYHPPTRAYPTATFILEANPSHFALVYPWPDDEPLPPQQTRPSESQFIMPVSQGPGDVSFVPAGQDRPYATTLRLEALRESIDDYEYMEILRNAAQEAPANSVIRQKYDELRTRLEALIHEGNLRTHYSAPTEKSIFVIDTEQLQTLRRDIARAVEMASRAVSPQS